MTGLPLSCNWPIHHCWFQTRLQPVQGDLLATSSFATQGRAPASWFRRATKRLVIQHGQTSRELAGPPQKMHSRAMSIPSGMRHRQSRQATAWQSGNQVFSKPDSSFSCQVRWCLVTEHDASAGSGLPVSLLTSAKVLGGCKALYRYSFGWSFSRAGEGLIQREVRRLSPPEWVTGRINSTDTICSPTDDTALIRAELWPAYRITQ